LTATAGYDRELEWDEPPSPSERRYAGWSVVRADGAPAPRWRPLARIGGLALWLAPPGTERDAPARYVEPIVVRKRGRKGSGDYVGVDGRVRLSAEGAEGPLATCPPGPYRWPSPPLAAPLREPRAVRVAIVDVSFDNVAALRGLAAGGAVVDGPYLVGLATDDGGGSAGASGARGTAPGHGTCMAGVVLSEAPGARLGLFRIPSAAGAARPYLASTDLAIAVAATVDAWRADVVLIPMSDAAWGVPRHLGDVLRAAAGGAAGSGGGRGVAIFCSVGDPSRNHVRALDSASLGADDLASQPWVQAIAASDREGRWYRVYPPYGQGAGVAYNRFGPSVALSASGEPRSYGGRVAADDSSQATALAAAAGARVLAVNRELSADELRTLLALTAHVPPIVDGGRGLGAELFEGRDRLGHNMKQGFGVVDPRAGCAAAGDPIALALLATRPIPDRGGPPGEGRPTRALLMAEALRAAVARAGEGAEGRADGGPPGDYARVAGRLCRLYLTALPVRAAFDWLGRHLHALAETAVRGRGGWWSTTQDHGALVDRVRFALDTVRAALDPADPVAAWAVAMEELLSDGGDDGAAAGAGLHAFLARALAPVMREPESTSRRDEDDRRGGQS
jgi:hypothetical protein